MKGWDSSETGRDPDRVWMRWPPQVQSRGSRCSPGRRNQTLGCFHFPFVFVSSVTTLYFISSPFLKAHLNFWTWRFSFIWKSLSSAVSNNYLNTCWAYIPRLTWEILVIMKGRNLENCKILSKTREACAPWTVVNRARPGHGAAVGMCGAWVHWSTVQFCVKPDSGSPQWTKKLNTCDDSAFPDPASACRYNSCLAISSWYFSNIFFLTAIQSIKYISHHNLYKHIHVHGTKVNISVKYTHSLTWSGDTGLPWGNVLLAITKSTK